MEIKYIKIADLKPFPENPRKISDKDKKDLVNSLREFGFVEPAVVMKSTMYVVGGNQRVFEGAVELGLTEVPCYLIDIDMDKAKVLNIALNKITGEWDYSKLQMMLNELPANLQGLTGWSGKELEKVMFLFQDDNSNILEEGNISDFERSLKNHEIRILIPKDYSNLEDVKGRVQNIKEDYPDIVIKEVM